MKRILITGANSYVGISVQQYLESFPQEYSVSTVSTTNDEWKRANFSSFDVVYHVAGIAHSDMGRVSDDVKKLYYAVNTDLAIAVAIKAKREGVKQFIFMSSAIVYGDAAPIGKVKIIKNTTRCTPANAYGDSKYQAENGLIPLGDPSFRVVILRCPMIYGRGSKGNFATLVKLAMKLPVFPNVSNARTLLYIKNLAEFIRLIIQNEESGIFWPCNKEQSNTSQLVKMVANAKGKRIILVPGLTLVLRLLAHLTKYVNKAFGNLVYDERLGVYNEEYRLYTMEQSIKEMYTE